MAYMGAGPGAHPLQLLNIKSKVRVNKHTRGASALSLGSLVDVTGQAPGGPGLTHHQNYRLVLVLLGPSTQGT